MSDASDPADPLFPPDGETSALLAAEVQRLARDTTRTVADRLSEMFRRFRSERVDGDAAARHLQAAAERGVDGYVRVLGSVYQIAAPLLARGLSALSRPDPRDM